MKETLRGKKLLLLGGVQPACEIVKEAHKLGVEVIVTDYLSDSPAKKIADKSFMVSATDTDKIVELCKEENIDGVITGYVDSLLPYYVKVCEKADFYHWGNEANISMCINKDLFKIACEESSVPVVEWKKITKNNYKEFKEKLHFPVVIKPVDNSGSRGVYKCFNKADYEGLCEKAFTYSKKQELLVERLMNPNNEFSAYYMIYDNTAYLTGMGDRYVNIIDDRIAPIGQGMIFPSRYLKEWKEKIHDTIVKFFQKNDIVNGFVFIQGFYEEGNFFIHEIGYRLNGGFSYKIIEKCSGYNQIQELIRFSLTGKMEIENLNKSNPIFNKNAFIITVSLKQGKIKKIKGLQKIREEENIIEVCQLHFEEEEMKSHGTTAQVFCYILGIAETQKEYKEIVKKIKNNLIVENEEGENIVNQIIDAEKVTMVLEKGEM